MMPAFCKRESRRNTNTILNPKGSWYTWMWYVGSNLSYSLFLSLLISAAKVTIIIINLSL